MSLLKTSQIAQGLQDGLNQDTDFNFFLYSEVAHINKLPNEVNGFLKNSNNIVGLLRTVQGGLNIAEGEQYYQKVLNGTFYIIESQYQDVYEHIFEYINSINAVPFTVGNFTYIPNFDVIRPGPADLLQGEMRVPLHFNIRYEIVENAMLSNDIEIHIDDTRVYVREWTAGKAKGVSSKVRTGDKLNLSTQTAIPAGQDISFTFMVLYTKNEKMKEIVQEMYSRNMLTKTHVLKYKDKNDIEEEFEVIFQNIEQQFEASGAIFLGITATIAKPTEE